MTPNPQSPITTSEQRQPASSSATSSAAHALPARDDSAAESPSVTMPTAGPAPVPPAFDLSAFLGAADDLRRDNTPAISTEADADGDGEDIPSNTDPAATQAQRMGWPTAQLDRKADDSKGYILRESNLVIVNIWRAGSGACGHGSITTSLGNKSLIPAPRKHRTAAAGLFDAASRYVTARLGTRPAEFVDTYRREVELFGEPDLRICLYGLNVVDIEQAYDNRRTFLSQPGRGWRYVGRQRALGSMESTQNAESCVSFAMYMLEAGGLTNQLLSTGQAAVASSEMASVIAPNNFAQHIAAAARNEMTRFPQSQVWHRLVPGGSSLAEIDEQLVPKQSLLQQVVRVISGF